MANMQREKGKDGERELAGLLRERLGATIKRNLAQAREGGYDLAGLPGLALEVKRQATATEGQIAEWWAQAEEQAQAAGLVPVLAYRADRRPWRFVVPLSKLLDTCPWGGVDWTATVGLEAFCAIVREGMP